MKHGTSTAGKMTPRSGDDAVVVVTGFLVVVVRVERTVVSGTVVTGT